MKKTLFPLILFTLLLLQCKNDDDSSMSNDVNISILDLSIDEGDEYTVIAISLQLDAASSQEITATISSNEGTAEAVKDYLPFDNETITFASGETEKTYEITIAGDLIFESDEYFDVAIVNTTGPVAIEDGTASVNLRNDDTQGIQTIPISPVLDWDLIRNLPPGSEASFEACNFGQPDNVSNEDFTTVGNLNDIIRFSPKTDTNGDTLLYLGIFFDAGINWTDYIEVNIPPVAVGDSVGQEVLIPINNKDINDVELKYDLQVMIGTAQGRFGPYVVDPKLRIPN